MNLQRSIAIVAAAAFAAGCSHDRVEYRDRGQPVAVRGDYAQPVGYSQQYNSDYYGEPQTEVVSGPGVEYVDTEPPIEQRTYVYDEGYPPGAFVCNNYVYYGAYRYPQTLFVNDYVQRNVREHRYVDREENRRAGQQIEAKQRTSFEKFQGKRPPRPGGAAAGFDAAPRIGSAKRRPGAGGGSENRRATACRAATPGRTAANRRPRAGLGSENCRATACRAATFGRAATKRRPRAGLGSENCRATACRAAIG